MSKEYERFTCKTCRWWGALGKQHSGILPPTYERVDAECKTCDCPSLIDINDAPGGYLAVKGNGFGLDYPVCDLITGPDFGCIHHEEKQ